MDQTGRKITKIVREVGKFTVQTMKEEGIGTAEFDFIQKKTHIINCVEFLSVFEKAFGNLICR